MANIYQAGNTENPSKALIMIHGRGGSARDIMGLSEYLNVQDYLLIGPEADQNTWYPNSFIAPVSSNQPKLDIALELIQQAVDLAKSKGITTDNIYILGFSQGACLTLEYSTRNAMKYGGIIAFTGGLIGEELNLENYSGDFEGTKVFIGTSDPDFHVPVERVQESSKLMEKLGAVVNEKIYPNMGHTISQDEIQIVNETIFK
ncbi:alpha/beta hydrolase [Sphingobacterium cellulitidis]|uniref:Phospholipase/carboxylesterase n=1 Tax=Sphingobacterium cellulitidis TaxID=1768011 RepID=A0A8H9KYJ9_9SPHI|nr:dienelactone hydrolase family protein [Sphingobacterium soli]MBA8986616.1 phospholipase/carboxylesterase [Sphingobacterium soli]OYD40993.1 phospholipase [Sphingobacterium cellulitidis]GGE27886.1 phospholipase/carboxylesterase [Sphingobacterium soli]